MDESLMVNLGIQLVWLFQSWVSWDYGYFSFVHFVPPPSRTTRRCQGINFQYLVLFILSQKNEIEAL